MSYVDESGRWFGRYRITDQLGAGGMAVVYRAVLDGPEGFQRSVVIKRVRPDFSDDPNFVKMLLAEARLSALLQHPGIVQVFELGQAYNEYYLAMEYVDGSNLVSVLKKIVQRGMHMPPGLACYIIAEVAAALAYAHDLKDDQGLPL